MILKGPLLPPGHVAQQPRDPGEPGVLAATSPSLVPASPWVGPCDLKGKISPEPPAGGGGGGKWGFVFLTLEDQASQDAGGSPGSSPMTQTQTLGGRRHQSAWAPGSSGQFPGWFSNTSLQVCGQEWGRGSPGRVGEPRGLGTEEPPWPWVPGPCLWELGWMSPSQLLHAGQESSRGQALERTEVPFTSSAPGRWRTQRRMARAWGLAAWGHG